ncbi:MAG: helix-turn-helix transcriptional regulator [Clostridia bacterium]|nr:helix-turn-helix transcriptional regulator [Clostridia bacterium]
MPNYIQTEKKYDISPTPDCVHLHTHDCYEIYCFLEGDAKYTVEGNFYDLRPGDILIMKKAEAHRLIIKSNAPYKRYVVNFYPEAVLGENAKELLDFIDNRPLGKYNRFPASLFKQKNWLYYLESLCKAEQDEQRIYLTVLLNELKKAYPQIKGTRLIDDCFSSVIGYINEHITENITLADICDFSFLSKSQLNRKFKAITGTTAWEYITVKRLLLAKEGLKNGKRPTVVYLECGFNDYSAFYRAYRLRFGVSPTDDFSKKSN